MTTLRGAAQQALDFIRWSQFVPCQSEPFPEPPSTAPQVEAALKAALAEPVQEPVAWIYQNSYTEQEYLVWKKGTGGRNWVQLYTAPPQRKPLTEEEIEVLEMQHAPPIHPDFSETDDWLDFARAIERAHGIT